MEVAFVSEFVGDLLVFRGIEGDARSFGFEEGGDLQRNVSYCKRVIDGRLPNLECISKPVKREWRKCSTYSTH
ncbi:MAG: hypothetical protein M3157_07785, partial [Actinomycetota bacterium]|nr:hypothetical protein [Actinomycetota bacterium]